MGKTGVEADQQERSGSLVEHQQDRGLKALTIDGTLRSIYAFIRYLVEADLLPADLLVKKIRIQVPKPLPRAMDPVDSQRLLATIDNIRDRALILLLLRTGMRIGELLNTCVDDLNLVEQKIFIMIGEKNRLGRTVCISDDACSALKTWLRKRDSIRSICSMARASRWVIRVRGRYAMYLKKAGLLQRLYAALSAAHLCHRTFKCRHAP